MAYHYSKRIHKPGFLLIEIMCAFLLMIIAGSIMGFYVALGNKQQKAAQNHLETLLLAGQAIENLREGHASFKDAGKFQIHLQQTPTFLSWADGTQDQVWIATMQVCYLQEKCSLKTILIQKAL